MIFEHLKTSYSLEVTSPTKRLPGAQGTWLFVLMDSTIFAILFLSYSLDKTKAADAFADGMSSMDIRIGTINTIILLTSSWLVALAAQEAKLITPATVRKGKLYLLGAAVLGMAFVGLKITEYAHVIGAGHTPISSDFHMYYFVTTGLHMLHVIIGVFALCVTSAALLKQGNRRAGYSVESVATYWHMVDFLWIMIFPLFYLAAS